MRNLAQSAVLHLLRAYRWAISPMFPPACRYVPTCSEYAMEAVERFGVLRGAAMAVWRLLRCHPLAHGGYDPVVKAIDASAAKAAVQEKGFSAALKRSTPSRQDRACWGPRRCATQNHRVHQGLRKA